MTGFNLPTAKMEDRRHQRRYSIRFFAMILALSAICVFATQRLEYFRDKPVDFYDLDQDTLVITYGLTRKQSASLKLGFLEHFQPPRVGLFGNHQFQFWTREAFGPSTQRRYFFNFIYANLALPELRDYIAYVAAVNKLPSDVVIVQVTTPNNDNGRYILGYNGELPADLVMVGGGLGGWDWLDKVQHVYQNWRNQLYNTLSYSSVLVGLLGSHPKDRILDRKRCRDIASFAHSGTQAILAKLPVTLRMPFLPSDPRKYCQANVFWGSAVRPDGSLDVAYTDLVKLIRDENPLRENSRQLKFGDERKIARYMREIADVVRAAKRKVVFVIPPVYESKRFSSVDRVLDEAIKLNPDIPVIDDRPLRDKTEFFVNYDHPSGKYFVSLVEKLKARNLLP